MIPDSLLAEITREFDRLAPVLQRALDRDPDGWTMEMVRDDVLSGRMLFFPGETSAVICQTQISRTHKILHYFLAAGTLDELRPMSQYIEKWARVRGYTRMTCYGRPGWTRSFLTQHDGWYQPKQVPLVKELSHG